MHDGENMEKARRARALARQVARLERRVAGLQRRSDGYSWLRVGFFLGGILGGGAAWFGAGALWFWLTLLLFTVLFWGTVAFHRQVEGSLARHAGWLALKREQQARMTLNWEQLPAPAPFEPRPDHPFESDLDLLGPASLHRLLDRSVSTGGSERLRAWLTLTEPEREESLARQRIVRELVPRSLFRDRLLLRARLAAGASGRWEAGRLRAWLDTHHGAAGLRGWLLLLSGLALVNALLLLLDVAGVLPPLWRGTLALYALLFFSRARAVGEIFQEALALESALQQLAALFEQLERYSYRDTPHLRARCAPFLDPEQRPSRLVARVARVVNATGVRGNPMVWLLLNAALPWDFFFAVLLGHLKSEIALHLPAWLEVWFDLEALDALATHAYLNPHYTFPDLRPPDPAKPVFQARALGHPLFPDAQKICNDFAIGHLGEVALLTGSNMAGKSSFLRTVGVALLLAHAGGAVDAQELRVPPFRLFTCIRVSDSVTDGISYFYAEVRRLRALLAALDTPHPLPLFFLIDEIFRGTNNHERLIGSRAYLRALAGKGGVGLVSTHDLELVRLADELPTLTNYHFREEVVEGRMHFDYRLRPGPCPTTNALRIMELEGLPV